MPPTAFDRWLADTLDREGTFTMFLILFAEAPGTIVPVRSSYLHVIGPDLRFDELAALIGEGGSDGEPGCLTVRRGELFDRLGRRLELTLAPN